jgi:hypothetical protein
MAVNPRRIVLGAQDGDVVPCGELAAQVERVNLGARLVAR